jgi:hypothetical protein
MNPSPYTFPPGRRRRNLSVFAALVLVAGLSPVSGQSLDTAAPALKGVLLGAPIDDVLARFPGSVCFPLPRTFRKLGDQRCELVGPDASTYGSARVLEMNAYAIGGRFEGFTVSTSWRDYEIIRDALRAKHGAGKEVTGVAQNLAGARVETRTWSATVDGAEVVVIENASPITQAAVSVASPALQQRRRAPAAAGSDL